MFAAGEKPDLTTFYGKSLFSEMINEFYSLIPEKYYFKVNNAELVWMYGANFFEDYDDNTFQNAKSNYSAVFGAEKDLEFVGVGFNKAESSLIGKYSWGISLNGATIGDGGIPIGCIGPGFYSEGAFRCGCQWNEGIRIQERKDGQYYLDSYEHVKRGSKWLVIEVWNEYHEGNDISYTEEFGDKYINLTRQIVDDFKTISFMDWRDIDTYITATACVGIISVLMMIKLKKLEE